MVVLHRAVPRQCGNPWRLGASSELVWSEGEWEVDVVGLLWRHAGALRWAVSAYIAIITAMGILAVSLPLSLAWPALAFIASDTVLALEKFVLTQSTRSMVWTSWFIWISYWVAQAGFLGMFAIDVGA